MERETTFTLPPLVVSISDLMRLKRELAALYEFLHQAALRHSDPAAIKLPKTSRMLDDLARTNNIDLLKRDQYEATVTQLDNFLEHAPRIHLAFSTDPSAAFVTRIVEWLRTNVHPGLVVQVGIQPTLAAGCVVRTTNKHFDLSLKHHFRDAKPKLIEKINQGVQL